MRFDRLWVIIPCLAIYVSGCTLFDEAGNYFRSEVKCPRGLALSVRGLPQPHSWTQYYGTLNVLDKLQKVVDKEDVSPRRGPSFEVPLFQRRGIVLPIGGAVELHIWQKNKLASDEKVGTTTGTFRSDVNQRDLLMRSASFSANITCKGE